MKLYRRCRPVIVLALILAVTAQHVALAASPILDRLLAPLKRHGREPESCVDPAIETLAANLDWLEHEVDRWGSVAPKSPDIWGEARLTKYRREVEQQLAQRIDQFDPNRISGSQAVTDTAFLAAAISLDSQPTLGEGVRRVDAPKAEVNFASINRNGEPVVEIEVDANEARPLFGKDGTVQIEGTFGVEQVAQLDQLKRYLEHLNELRRINEGDDDADAPGYSLNLIRVPVSILPGTKSRRGYGAQITFTATPVIDDQLLPSTFRDLVINDLVDQLSVPMTLFLNQNGVRVEAIVDNAIKLDHMLPILNDRSVALVDQLQPFAHAIEIFNDERGQRFRLYNASTGQFAEPIDLLNFEEFTEDLSMFSAFAVAAFGLPHRVNLPPARDTAARARPEATPTLPPISLAELIQVDAQHRGVATDAANQRLLVDLAGELQAINDRATAWTNPIKTLGQDDKDGDDAKQRVIPLRKVARSILSKRPVLSPRNRDAVDQVLRQLAGSAGFDGNDTVQVALALQLAIQRAIEDAEAVEGFTQLARSIHLPNASTRKSTLPYAPRHLAENIGFRNLANVVRSSQYAFKQDLLNRQVIHATDVQGLLREELTAAYALLSRAEMADVWQSTRESQPDLCTAIRLRRRHEIAAYRDRFLQQAGFRADQTTPSLAWAVYVESVLLSERLGEAIAKQLGHSIGIGVGHGDGQEDFLPDYFGPDPSPEARDLFAQYVASRWPVKVFSIDPVATEQNIADSSSVQRQMQLAVSLAFAGGEIGVGAATRMMRTIQRDIATIDLNRTAVGFAHGNDTFGWRFTPRFQTRPVEGNLTVLLRDLIAGGPTDRQLLRSSELEPGLRECVAVVITPSFVSDMVLETRSEWFCLDKPGHTVPSVSETVRYSRSIQAMRQSADACVRRPDLYRDGEVGRMLTRVRQLDRTLPMQTLHCRLPVENTLGGFEILASGQRELAPELLGWYGSPGYDAARGGAFFLAGDNFSVHETRVIAGNASIESATLLSRQIMQVDLPPGLPVITDERIGGLFPHQYGGYVDVHVASPYGVSGHLLIPVVREGVTRLPPPRSTTVVANIEPPMLRGQETEFDVIVQYKKSAWSIQSVLPQQLSLAMIQFPAENRPSTQAEVTFLPSVDGGSLDEIRFDQLKINADGQIKIDGDDVLTSSNGNGGIRDAIKPYVEWYLQRHHAEGVLDEGVTIPVSMTATVTFGNDTRVIDGRTQMTLRLRRLE